MRKPILCLAAALVLCVPAGPAAGDTPSRRGGRKPAVQNRLATERSAYLREHATNPVDWYPWGPAAFQRARAENKPLFLSVGYAACHWCHVMERESFSDPATARQLNDAFVCVKVDREERPDIDRIYMTAAYALGRPGGWPLSVVLTPDGKPFWAGTYLRPADISKVAAKIKTDWSSDRASIEAKADWTSREIQKLTASPRLADTRLSDRDLVQGVRLKMQSRYDRLNGGIASAKKFPPHAELLFYLDDADGGLTRTELEFVAFTLGKMEEGGIHDQVGGGFHRYTVDERWFLPHFEKMLYDNALLIRAYARMFRRSGLERFRRVARRALAFVQRDLALPAGGYASSLDADTNEEEGLTYTWSIPELKEALNGSDLGFITNLMGVRQGGNYFVTSAGGRNNRNVLYLPAPVSKFAQANNANPDLVWMRMDAMLTQLRQARAKRPQPRRDDKMITAWNGLLLGAMAEAGMIMKDDSIIEQARTLGHYIVNNCRRDNGTLLRFPRASGPEIMGFCEDYAHLIDGLLTLAEATNDDRYLTYAADFAHRMIKGFEDKENGGFWATSHGGHQKLIARTKSYTDAPLPSDNGTAARVLLLLADRTGDTAFRDAANRTLATYRPMMARPAAALNMIALVGAVKLRDELEVEALQAKETESEPVVQIRQDVVRVEFFVDGALDEVLDSVRVRARVTLDGGWHVNTNAPGKAGLVGTVLGAATSSTIRLTSVDYPEPTQKTLMLGEEPLSLYEGTFEISADVERIGTSKTEKPELVLTLQPCSASVCKEPLTIRLPIR